MRFARYLRAILAWSALGSAAIGSAQGTSLGSAKTLGSVWRWDVVNGHADVSSDPVPSAALYGWSEDGTVLAVADGTAVQVVNRAHDVFSLAIPAGHGKVTALTLNRPGTEVAAATSAGYLVVWKDFRSPAVVEKQVSSTEVSSLAFNVGGEWLATGGSSLDVWDTQDWKAVRSSAPFDSWITTIAFGKANELAVGDFNGHIHVLNPQGERTTNVQSASGSVAKLAFNADGSLLAAGGVDGVVKVWGGNWNAPIAVLTEKSRVMALSFYRDRAILAVATDANEVSTWDIASQRRLRTLAFGNKFASAIAFTANDQLCIGLQASPPPAVVTLHILAVVGGAASIGREADAARADAVAVVDALGKGAQGSYGRIAQHMIVDDGSGANRLREAFRAIARDALAGDSLFVYFVAPPERRSGPASTGLVFANGTTVPLAQVAHWLDDIAAVNQTIALDSAGATEQQDELRILLGSGKQKQARDKRQRLFLAFDRQERQAGSDDLSPSVEMLTQGVSGEADRYPKDGRTTALELRTFLDQRALPLTDTVVRGKFELDGDDFNVVSPQGMRGSSMEVQPKLSRVEADFQKHHDYALLFATDNYDSWPQLTNPVQDATAIRDELRDKYGFEVELLIDQTQAQMYDALARYQRKDFQPGDQLLIFFAGHGDFDENANEGFLVAKDSKLHDLDVNRNTFIPHSRLRNYIDNIPIDHVLVMMDVCFGGTFDRQIAESSSARGGMYEDQPIEKLFVTRSQYKTRVFLTSGGKVYVPDGIPGHNSPFVHNLLGELRNPSNDRGYITFADLQSAVSPTVPAPVWGTWGKNDAGSDFFLVSRTARTHARAAVAITAPEADSTVNQRTVVCFVGLKNISGDLGSSMLGDQITELVTSGLGAGERLNIVSSQEVSELKRSLPLEDSTSYERATLIKIRQNTHADRVIAGSFLAQKGAAGQLIVSLTIQDAVTGETKDTISLFGTQDGLFDLIRKASASLLQKLGVSDLSEMQLAKATAGMPTTQKAIAYYAEAMEQLRHGEAKSAIDLLTKADAAEPGVAFVEAGLSDAWQYLGYDKKATAAAALALSYGQGLPEQETGALQARLSVLQGKLPEAIEAYRGLVMYNPDKLQFGLKLAETESTAGRGERALKDLASLENLPPPLGSDPRISLDEAKTYEALGKFPQDAEAARQAQTASAAIGARLLEAQANLSLCWAQQNLGNWDSAVVLCQQAYDIYQHVGDKLGMARSQSGLGTSLDDKSDFAGALAKYRIAAELTESIGARTDRAGAMQNIARIQIGLGQTSQAEASLAELTALAQEVDNSNLQVDTYFFRADLAHTAGDIAEAQQYMDEALKLANDSGNEGAVARVFSFQATYDLERGALDTALVSAERCIDLRTKNAVRAGAATCQQTKGQILVEQNHLAEARSAYEAAEQTYEQIGQPGDAAEVWLAQARLSTETGALADGESLARKALLEFVQEKDAEMQASALCVLLYSLAEQGKRAEAEQSWNALTQLHPGDPDIQEEADIAEARYQEMLGNFERALAQVGQSRDLCKRQGWVGCELRARLLEDEIRARAGKNEGVDADLQSLAKEASRLGFNLIAEKAAKGEF